MRQRVEFSIEFDPPFDPMDFLAWLSKHVAEGFVLLFVPLVWGGRWVFFRRLKGE